MGRPFRGLLAILGLGLLLVLAAPVLAILPSMVIDRGVDGSVRVSAFPAALVVLDPLVWRCVRNSVVVAILVVIGSLALGLGLGMILGRRRFWGRWLLGLLAFSPLVFGPTWMTPGVIEVIGTDASWEWLAARMFLGQPGDDWARWIALVWVGITCATPLVILAVRAGLARVDPGWADAARVVGAGRFRVWRDVTWPTLKPALGRVGGWIFVASLVEPAGPTLLGLRRTLVVEMADAAFRFDEPNRSASLAAIALGIAALGRSLMIRWGGQARLISEPGLVAQRAKTEVPRAGKRMGGFVALVLAAWIVSTLGPVVSVTRRLVVGLWGEPPWTLATVEAVVARSTWVELGIWASNAALTASLAVGIDLVAVAWLTAGSRRLAKGFSLAPPLALAVGALAIPSLLAAWADHTTWPGLAEILRSARLELSPGRSPSWLLVLVLASVHLPWLIRSLDRPTGTIEPSGTDAALLAGASAREARALAGTKPRRARFSSIAFVWLWSSTDLASSWVLASHDERRTLANAALGLMSTGPDPTDPRPLGLLAATTALKILALAIWIGSQRRNRFPDGLVG